MLYVNRLPVLGSEVWNIADYVMTQSVHNSLLDNLFDSDKSDLLKFIEKTVPTL